LWWPQAAGYGPDLTPRFFFLSALASIGMAFLLGCFMDVSVFENGPLTYYSFCFLLT
jgi:hypothetical protein